MNPSSRPVLAAFLAAAVTPALHGQQARPLVERQKPIPVSTERHLFLDDELVEARAKVVRVMHRPVKQADPVLVGDQPWEKWTVYLFGSPSIHFDPVKRLYRMWYTACDVPVDHYFINYATSTDAVHWTKPLLHLQDFKGSKANNIVNQGRVFWINSTVILDERETNPERRYKSLSWDFAPAQAAETWPEGFYRPSASAEHKKGRPLGVSVAFSPDGLHWQPYEGNPVLMNTGDTHSVIGWDESYKKYVGYFRPSYAASGGIRVIGFSTSDDFIHWTPPEIILKPDAEDPISDEFYDMPVVKYQGSYIGFLWMYHNSPNPALVRSPTLAHVKGSQQALDTQLTYSRDGKSFIRVGNREPFLPVGAPGTWDQGWATVSDMIVRDQEIWLYYSGWGTRHNNDQEQLGKVVGGLRLMAAIGLAKLRLDGFASLHADDAEGIVQLRPIALRDQRHLRVNADTSRGMLAVELLDENHDPIAGFTRSDFEIM
ncbi:MAG: hypothetical protein DMG07_23780, partial [Acidobacteria bacterium]